MFVVVCTQNRSNAVVMMILRIIGYILVQLSLPFAQACVTIEVRVTRLVTQLRFASFVCRMCESGLSVEARLVLRCCATRGASRMKCDACALVPK